MTQSEAADKIRKLLNTSGRTDAEADTARTLAEAMAYKFHLPGDDELEEVFYRLHVRAPFVHTFVSKLTPMNVGIDLAKPDSP